MAWVKALHIVFMVTWFAGLFYLPRLFIYHAMSADPPSQARFKIMEHKLYWMITTPGAVFTLLSGFILLYGYAWAAYKTAGWLHGKLALVLMLVIYHGYCGILLREFKTDRCMRSQRWLRIFNEVPSLILLAVVILVVVKPALTLF